MGPDLVITQLHRFLATKGVFAATGINNDPATGETELTTIAPEVPTALKHRFVDGCLYEIWEEPLPKLEPTKGTPA